MNDKIISTSPQINTFSFNSSEIRVIVINGIEHFVAKDIAELLSYKRPADAVSQHCKRAVDFEIGKIPNANFSSKARLIKLIPESDVWRLIIKSRLPEAEKIEKWIMEEVLPQIRKTGSYSLQKTEKLDFEEIQKTLNFGEKVLETLNSKNVFEKIQLDNLVKTQNGISILETLKINFDNLLFLPTELGKFLGISPIEMNQNLREKGLQIKTDGVWKLTEKGKKFGVDVSETFPQIKWKIEALFL
ncbi:prophage antirepressor [Thiovulum sp. ES]|nr:prophage antirepressor [Thiovulum sp. ES]